MKTGHRNLCFATAAIGEAYIRPASRLIREVKDLRLTDRIYCISDHNFDNFIGISAKKLIKKYKVDPRQAFIWKPWYILSILNQIDENDVLVYLDAGCEISYDAKKELLNIIEDVSLNGSKYFSNGLFVKNWCEVGCYEILQKRYKSQGDFNSVVAGVLLLRNDLTTKKIIREWAVLTLHRNGYLFVGNEEKKHRHDQSVLSFVLKRFAVILSIYPVWFQDWNYGVSTTYAFPIHTLRNKTSYKFLPYMQTKLFRRIVMWGYGDVASRILKLYLRKKSSLTFLSVVEPECFSIGSLRLNTVNAFRTQGDKRCSKDVIYSESASLNNAYIFSNGDVYISKLGWLLAYRRFFSNIKFSPRILNNIYLMLGRISCIKNLHDAKICLNENSFNLYHFLFDCFGLTADDGNRYPYLFNDGIRNIKLFFANREGSEAHFIKRLPVFVANLQLGKLKNYSGDVTELELNRLSKFSCKKTHNRVVFINRNIKDGRAIILSNNQKEMLARSGVQIVDMSAMKVEDQIRLFSNATKIIAPHGAALSWIYACKPGAQIIEIFNELYRNDCYMKMCNSKNVKYRSLIGYAKPNRFRWNDPNIILTDCQLEEALNG